MEQQFRRSIVWLRRDLRLRDNVALLRACESSEQVVLAFVVDPALLRSGRMGAPLVQAFFSALRALRADLRERGGDLALLEGDADAEIAALARRIGASAVFFNEDYEPFARQRDRRVSRSLESAGLAVSSQLDHVYFGCNEVVRDDGEPYRVFTPYRNRWLARFSRELRPPVPSLRRLAGKLIPAADLGGSREVPMPEDFGYSSSDRYPGCSERIAGAKLHAFTAGPIEQYAAQRDYPAKNGTSGLSPQLRAGTIGIRTCFAAARDFGVWMNELIWREFFQMILARFPYVADGPFLEAGNRIRWRSSDADFEAWTQARTGFPLVDAAMHQLNTTGWMHNRLRMIAASFLTKDLLIDWRLGERYFEQHLADADLAQNNGGWQWCASTGADAVPYFRIFNPASQAKKFDPDGAFVRAMLPGDYDAKPIVDHDAARRRALEVYTRAFKG